MLDSHVVADSENTFMQILPDGYTTYYWRKKESPDILLGQAGWAGEVKEEVINLYASCGWKLSYQQGKLASITSPKNRVIKFLYRDGKVSELQEKGKTILKVESDPATGAVTGLTYGKDRKIAIEQGEKPRLENLAGQNVVGGIDQSLSKNPCVAAC